MPATGDPALTLTGASNQRFEDLAFESLDANDFGESSVAVVVDSSENITFERVTITAGNGVDAVAGMRVDVDLPVCTGGDCTALQGNSAVTTLGGAGKSSPLCLADNMMSSGGPGGNSPNGPGGAGLPSRGAGVGGTGLDCGLTGTGTNGNPGVNGSDGAAAAGGSGRFAHRAP
jgi:hypothetical protein